MLFQQLIVTIVVFALVGCSSSVLRPESGFSSDTGIWGREVLARKLTEKHDFAEALVQWNILQTIDPENEGYRTQAGALRKLINEESAQHLATGLKNLRLGAYDTARLSFLKVLALDPRRRDALGYLREIDEQQARAKSNNGTPDPAYRRSNGR